MDRPSPRIVRLRRLVFASVVVAVPAFVAGATSLHTSAATPPLAPSLIGATPETVTPAAVVPGARVIVHEVGRRQHPGTLEIVSDDVVVIRDPKGTVRSFPRSRVVEIVALLEPDSGRSARVALVDGRMFEGLVVADEFEHMSLEIEGVRVRLARAEIASVRLLPTFQEQYAHFKRLTDESSAASWTELCRWLASQERWPELSDEAGRLLERHGRFRPAEALKRIADAQLALTKAPAKSGDPETGRGEGDRTADSDGTARPSRETRSRTERKGDIFDRTIISEADVNAIRVFEIDFDQPPRLAVPRDTIDRLIQRYAADPRLPSGRDARRQLTRAEPAELVRLIFELRARELYPEIQVRSEPDALLQFRRSVHDAWLINSCGACHAGPDAGRFRLHTENAREAEVAFTNLLILERVELSDGESLLDWQRPLDSRLIQHALPRHIARDPHPAVEGFKPGIRDLDSRVARRAAAWMQSMFRPRPDYPVEYDPNDLIARARAERDAAAGDGAAPPAAPAEPTTGRGPRADR